MELKIYELNDKALDILDMLSEEVITLEEAKKMLDEGDN